MAWGHVAAGSLPGAHPTGSSQLLKGDLNLAVELPHVQQEGDMVAIMLNDVVVHVDQDSGREEMWLDCGRPPFPGPLGDKDDSSGYYISGTPHISSTSRTFSLNNLKASVRCSALQWLGHTHTGSASDHAHLLC